MNRCLNDCFCYCKGEPDASIEGVDVTYTDLGGKEASQHMLVTICHKDKSTCPDRLTHSQLQALNSHFTNVERHIHCKHPEEISQ